MGTGPRRQVTALLSRVTEPPVMDTEPRPGTLGAQPENTDRWVRRQFIVRSINILWCFVTQFLKIIFFCVQFNDEEGENLKDIYNSDWASQDATSAQGAAARSLESAVPASPLTSLVNKAIDLIN